MDCPLTPGLQGFFKITSGPVPPDGFALIPAGSFEMGDQADSLSWGAMELPVHTVKIDYSFVAEIEHSKKGAALVAAIVGMAQGLGINVIAEGVESTAQSEYLESLGCHIMQGYLFGRPVAVNDFLGAVARQHGNTTSLSSV